MGNSKGGAKGTPIPPDLLYSLSVQHNEGVSIYKLAKLTGYYPQKIKKELIKAGYGVQIKTKDNKTKIIAPGVIGIPKEEIDKEELRKEHEKKLTEVKEEKKEEEKPKKENPKLIRW